METLCTSNSPSPPPPPSFIPPSLLLHPHSSFNHSIPLSHVLTATRHSDPTSTGAFNHLRDTCDGSAAFHFKLYTRPRDEERSPDNIGRPCSSSQFLEMYVASLGASAGSICCVHTCMCGYSSARLICCLSKQK